jgi:hypothetical protein
MPPGAGPNGMQGVTVRHTRGVVCTPTNIERIFFLHRVKRAGVR